MAFIHRRNKMNIRLHHTPEQVLEILQRMIDKGEWRGTVDVQKGEFKLLLKEKMLLPAEIEGKLLPPHRDGSTTAELTLKSSYTVACCMMVVQMVVMPLMLCAYLVIMTSASEQKQAFWSIVFIALMIVGIGVMLVHEAQKELAAKRLERNINARVMQR